MVAEGSLDAKAGEGFGEEGVYAALGHRRRRAGGRDSGPCTSRAGLGVEAAKEVHTAGEMVAGARVVSSEELEVDEDKAGDKGDAKGMLA